jgi:4'-phosphopantetheinyl transferase
MDYIKSIIYMKIHTPYNFMSDKIYLWFAFPEEIQDVALLEKYYRLLSSNEKARYRRFQFEKHRHHFLVAHALVRTMLSSFTGIASEDIQFSENRYGRPELSDTGHLSQIRFNLSHTDRLVACAVVLKQDIGVDVEFMERRGPSIGIADRFFSTTEVNALNRIPEPENKARFFDYWTLKESYIKARGMGLSLPLKQFSFHLTGDGRIRISFDPQLRDDPDRWQFWLLEPTRQHKAALSATRENRTPFELIIKKSIPLLGQDDFRCVVVKQSFVPDSSY